MKSSKKFISILLFLILNSFILGIIFLFFINTPFEEFLVQNNLKQKSIDLIMKLFILLWIIISIISTIFFYKKVILSNRKKTMVIILVLNLILSAIIFYQLLNTNLLVGRVKEIETVQRINFTFGSYPDKQKLLSLKKEGYTGVITLLSPDIIFEKVLLEREISFGEDIDLKISSYPMLPWISRNKDSIDQIIDLINSQNGKYYIHCYLGKHRVDLIRQVIEDILSIDTEEKIYISPDKIERGQLTYYKDGNITIGAFPTDEEWFHVIQRGNYKEIISVMDANNIEDTKWIEKEKEICEELGIKFTILSMRKSENSYIGFDELKTYINQIDHKVYIHSFITDGKTKMINDYFQKDIINKIQENITEDIIISRINGFDIDKIPKIIDGIETNIVSRKLIVGVKPNYDELVNLKNIGLRTVVYLRGRDKETDIYVLSIQKLVEQLGLNFLEVNYNNNYLNTINKEILKEANPCYLIVAEFGIYQTVYELNNLRIR